MGKRRNRPSGNPSGRKRRYLLARGKSKKRSSEKTSIQSQESIRLNRYIASAGICSRRDADKLISEGRIKVNGETVTTLGYKVKRGDIVFYGKEKLNLQNHVYVLLNKPKDFITTTDDPQNRKTVMDLVSAASTERIFPVGRLDRLTTGLLLMTNDGDLAKKLSHPSHRIKKVYQVTLDKPISNIDLEAIQEGLALEDGPAIIDDIVVLSRDKKEIGLELHIGRNRIVRRIFERLNYKVKKLDRVVFAGLTKKDLPRGKWRILKDKEVIGLKHF